MSEKPKMYSPSYTVERYDKLCKSYAVRSKIIPHDDKEKFIDYITSHVVFHGGLAGPLSITAQMFSKPIQIITSENSLRAKIVKILSDLQFQETQAELWLSLFMYSNTCLIYFPKQIVEMTCPECKHAFVVNRSSYPFSFMIVDLNAETDYSRKARTTTPVGREAKRQLPKQYGIACECPKCSTTMKGLPEVKWAMSTPGTLMVLNPKLFEVDVNAVGKERIIIDPKYYNGKLKLDTEIEWFDLDGVPWNLATTYASKDMVYLPEESMYRLFSIRRFSALGESGESIAPIVSSVSDMVSMDIYKMGNEGLAFSKIDPLYIISPMASSGSLFEGISHGEFRDFMIQNIKAHQEGDINRLIYSPMPVDTNALFGDGKRFLSINELVTFQNFVLQNMGFSSDSSFLSDPVKFEAWNNIMRRVQEKMLSLLNYILELCVRRFKAADSTEDKEAMTTTLWMETLSELTNGMSFETKFGLVREQKLPMEVITRSIGIPDPEYWRSMLRNSIIDDEKFQMRLERDRMKLSQAELEKADPEVLSGAAPNMQLARQAIEHEAEEMSQQLFELSYEERRSKLGIIKNEDPILHAVIMQKLEVLHSLKRQEQEQQG